MKTFFPDSAYWVDIDESKYPRMDEEGFQARRAALATAKQSAHTKARADALAACPDTHYVAESMCGWSLVRKGGVLGDFEDLFGG